MSAAEGIVKLPELRKRLLFSLLMLAVYRLGVHISVPGVDPAKLSGYLETQKNTLFSVFSLFSGGAIERFSVFALGVMPYISASIIFQLLTVVWPYLAELQKEGEQGRKRISQYTRYATVLLALFQGYGIATGLENMEGVVATGGIGFRFFSMISLATGTVFLMWLGEQITERGIGNGTSLIIFSGIASAVPAGISRTFDLVRSGQLTFISILVLAAVIAATFFVIIFVERAQRKIPVHYAKRVVGRKVYGGQNTHLPLKINSSGVIPPIFASSLLMFPATIGAFFSSAIIQKVTGFLQFGTIIHDVLYVGLIVFFCFFYTAVTFKSDDVAENLKKYGGFVPGIRPGRKTAEFIEHVLSRITVGGAAYISVICILPTLLAQKMSVPFAFGGTSVLILVGVALDTVAQVESFLLTRNYEGFVQGTRIRGRRQ